MSAELSIWALVLKASVLVQCVMGLLLLASVVSWGIILQRARILSRAHRHTDAFEASFWSGIELNKLFQRLSTQRTPSLGLENIFMSGFKNFSKLYKQNAAQPTAVVGGVERALRVASVREIDQLEFGLPLLATIGSVSPYIGLFGTVWGIMDSFRALGQVQQASLNLVAPGIAEALVATAMGLFAAIPAVIAYNRFGARAQSLTTRYQLFAEELLNILHRQAYRKVTPAVESPGPQ